LYNSILICHICFSACNSVRLLLIFLAALLGLCSLELGPRSWPVLKICVVCGLGDHTGLPDPGLHAVNHMPVSNSVDQEEHLEDSFGAVATIVVEAVSRVERGEELEAVEDDLDKLHAEDCPPDGGELLWLFVLEVPGGVHPVDGSVG